MYTIRGGRMECGVHNLLKCKILLKSKKLSNISLTLATLIGDGVCLLKCMIFYTIDCKKLYLLMNYMSDIEGSKR